MPLNRKQKKDVDFCSSCPKLCRHACPVGNADCRETVSPWGKMTMMKMVDDGRAALDSDSSSVFYKCLGCLLCRSYCKHEIVVPDSLIAGRELAVINGAAPQAVIDMGCRFASSHNPAGRDLAADIRKVLPAQNFEKGVSAVFFAGCMHTARDTGVIGRFFEIAAALGVDYMGAWGGEPYCCGLPLHTAGMSSGFRKHAAALSKELAAYRLIVTPCPACAYTLKVLYPDMGFRTAQKVQHVSEFLAPIINVNSVKSPSGRTMAWHDPCYLGRYMGVYDEPRKLLETCGVKLAEFQWGREMSYCCGGGGNLPLTSKKTAGAVADKRRSDFKKTGADAIATGCPSCEAMLGHEGSGVEVVDLMDVVHSALMGK